MSDVVAFKVETPILVDARGGQGTGGKGDPGSPGEGYATRAAMAARLAPALKDDVHLNEVGREGKFVVDAAASWTAAIAADPQQGVFVLSTADASKVYIRIEALAAWRFNIRHFGAKLDNSTNDYTAIAAAVALSYAMRIVPTLALGIAPGYGAGGGPAVYVPGIAYIGSTLTFLHTFRFFGDSLGIPSSIVSGLRGPAGMTFIENPGRASIEGIVFIGPFGSSTTTEGEFHGIHATQVFPYRHLGFWNLQGDAMNLDDASGGNVNGVIGENVWVFNCRDAYNNKAGGDNNAGTHKNWNVDSCRRLGLNESTFLGVGHRNHEFANCSLTSYNDGVNIACSVTSYSGNRYFVIAGQETWCSTHAPSGTTADNQGWAYLSAGGAAPSTGIIAWVSGILCRVGGSVYCPGTNIGSSFDFLYQEGGMPLAQIRAPAIVNGGALAAAVWKGNGSFPRPVTLTGGLNSALINPGGFAATGYTGTDETFSSQLGESSQTVKTIVQATASASFPSTYRMEIGAGNISFNYGNGVQVWFYLTGPNTALTFGRTAPVPYAFWPPNFMLGATAGVARSFTMDSAAPTTGFHQFGEIVFNYNPSAGGKIGWVCTAGGTPGTWKQWGVIDA